MPSTTEESPTRMRCHCRAVSRYRISHEFANDYVTPNQKSYCMGPLRLFSPKVQYPGSLSLDHGRGATAAMTTNGFRECGYADTGSRVVGILSLARSQIWGSALESKRDRIRADVQQESGQQGTYVVPSSANAQFVGCDTRRPLSPFARCHRGVTACAITNAKKQLHR